jgi:hypothetical protein
VITSTYPLGVRAELKSLFSMELSGSLEAYKPQDPKQFGIRVMAFIGSPDDERSDSFDLLVCTATWLADHFDDPRISRWDFENNELLFGNRFVFMSHWDYQAPRDAITGVVALHEADDWGTLANRIGRHIPWDSTTSTTRSSTRLRRPARRFHRRGRTFLSRPIRRLGSAVGRSLQQLTNRS